jgi:hypothetical protein
MRKLASLYVVPTLAVLLSAFAMNGRAAECYLDPDVVPVSVTMHPAVLDANQGLELVVDANQGPESVPNAPPTYLQEVRDRCGDFELPRVPPGDPARWGKGSV